MNLIVFGSNVDNFSSHFSHAARKRPHEGYTSSDSEEEILRRLRMQQSDSMHSSHLSKYGAGTLNENSSLQHITIASHREKFNDPLGVAERGKVGVPPSSSECSSNSSADASVESNMGILNGVKKGMNRRPFHAIKNTNLLTLLTDRRLIMSETKSFDSNSTSTTLKETRIDNRIERSNSVSSRKYQKMPMARQDSIDHTPDVSNNNQDVIQSFIHYRIVI